MTSEMSLAQGYVQAKSYIPYDQIILFGDSITQFSAYQGRGFAFSPQMQDDYVRKLDVLNRGFSGYTSSQGLNVLPQFFPPPHAAKVRIMTVFFGANDAVLPPGDQYVPLEKYVQNLKAIIQHPVVRYGGTKIVLLTPPPVNEYQLTAFDLSKGVTPLSRSANNTKLYAGACREVGKSLHVAIADIWSAFMREAGWVEGQPIAGSKEIPENPKLASLLIDGLHFSGDGYKVMYDEVLRAIRETYPEEAPERQPVHFPPYQFAEDA
ncbi:GDSL Lipase/Acylhydrolase [Trichophyton tonsurans CBS 112818]|uniref:GDSL Lipase/Acylhydrolase n=2 Tax=Trichophyton TaxID=5550 RepID=F2PLV9_TRIEC|nr:GDSL Lipase/Acylhydrolase [Trichophyton tonsurans CBS 112818]EGE02877.1 GDSL Lipase/Acylhydrolase [Trichophyton equinum CBS 127.97]